MKMPISMFPLFLLVGVALGFPWHLHGDDDAFQPVMSRSNEKRICVELCMSGLGGDACGEDCADLSPLSIPIQSDSVVQTPNKVILSETGAVGKPRNESCPVLCANNLGYPLCNCKTTENRRNKVDFVEICGHFCINYNYQIFGCQPCDIYQNISKEGSIPNLLTSGSYKAAPTTNMVLTALHLDPYWVNWCVNKCSEGEGGSACNCDKPVMATRN